MNIEALICQFDGCKMLLHNPITLHCGNSLCQHHLDTFKNQFKCFFCDEKHQIPKNGFQINKSINLMLNSFIEMDPLRKEIKESFEDLNKLICDYEKLDPDGFIFEYIGDVINNVCLHRDELIKEINAKSDEIIKILKEKSKTCKSNASKLQKINLCQLKSNDFPSWIYTFRVPQLKKEELNDLLAKLNEKKVQLQNEMKKYKSDLLMNESINYDQYDDNLFGDLSFNSCKSNLLSRNFGQLIQNFDQHSDRVTSIQVHEKSKKLISVSDDSTIKIWDLETGECLKTLNEHQKWVTGILIIPIYSLFISGSHDSTIKIWDLNTYECLNTLECETAVFSLCLISNDQIACGCAHGKIQIWPLLHLNRMKSFFAHCFWVSYLSPIDKTKLISCSGERDTNTTIKIWDLETLDCIIELEGHSSTVHYSQLTTNGRLFSCSDDQTVKLWQIETGELLKSIEFEDAVTCMKCLNEDLIIVALGNGEIQIYDDNEKKIIKTVSAHTSMIYQFCLLSNGNLVSSSDEGDIKLWEIFE